MISVFGKEFIQSISVEESHNPEIKLPGDLVEINFIRSFGGICALRFVGMYGERIGECD